jgi:hypothetical protein
MKINCTSVIKKFAIKYYLTTGKNLQTHTTLIVQTRSNASGHPRSRPSDLIYLHHSHFCIDSCRIKSLVGLLKKVCLGQRELRFDFVLLHTLFPTGEKFKTWKKRWFELRDGILTYAKNGNRCIGRVYCRKKLFFFQQFWHCWCRERRAGQLDCVGSKMCKTIAFDRVMFCYSIVSHCVLL